jgi:hypothetical protein
LRRSSRCERRVQLERELTHTVIDGYRVPAAISHIQLRLRRFRRAGSISTIVISASPEFSFATYGPAFLPLTEFHSYWKGLKGCKRDQLD